MLGEGQRQGGDKQVDVLPRQLDHNAVGEPQHDAQVGDKLIGVHRAWLGFALGFGIPRTSCTGVTEKNRWSDEQKKSVLGF